MRKTGNNAPPRRATMNPAPRTDSAKQALKNFYCDLCQKGYGRMNEYETHINSYEHQHKKRYNELRKMQKSSSTVEERRERQLREVGIRAISLDNVPSSTVSSPTGVMKNAGFKSIAGGGFKKIGIKNISTSAAVSRDKLTENSDSEADMDYVHYNPRQPTS
ncbi:uncharacterized protein V1516DRAFT_674854 [Lipomyces oligophaga]|uniref:uncharacterized protein n=1 Tax=Lipomyces oligophaga TaxID=45792 RepID=UPI0034CF1584